MKKWPKSYPCHARRDSENGNGALVKQTFASEQIRVPNYIPQGELSQCLLFLCLLWNPHRWQGRTLSGIRDERNSHCFTTDCIGFNWFRCAGQHFRLKVYFKKKKEQRNSPSTFKSIVSLFHPHVAVGSRFIMVCPNLGRQASPSPFLEGSLGVSLQVVVPFCAFMYVLFVSQFVW